MKKKERMDYHTPHFLNLVLKRIKSLLLLDDYTTVLLHTEFERMPLHPSYFSLDDWHFFKQGYEEISMYSYLEAKQGALDAVAIIRKRLDRIMTNNLLLIHRLFPCRSHQDVGTLDILPELVKARVYNIVFTDL
jgi:hypothetical protein